MSQALVTHGPYQWIRHPIYAAFLLILGAAASDCRQLVPRWMFHHDDAYGRIRYEEETLRSRFGPAYPLCESLKHNRELTH